MTTAGKKIMQQMEAIKKNYTVCSADENGYAYSSCGHNHRTISNAVKCMDALKKYNHINPWHVVDNVNHEKIVMEEK